MSNDNELNKQPPPAAHASSGEQPAGHQPPPPATHPAAGIEARPAARLLEFLVCPSTKGPLELSADRTELISRKARLAYPIRDGVPLLTADTARTLSDEDLRR